MIKEKLNKLHNKNLDNNVNHTIEYINENYNDESLLFILSNYGFKLNEDIILKYHNGYGFYCYDINESLYGKSPLCQNIQRFLNKM